MSIRCRHCPASTSRSVDFARAAGWRMFNGTTQSGKPLNDVVCPACAGTADQTAPVASWRVRCLTCDWVWEDEYHEGPLTAEDAHDMADEHRCERQVEVAPPSGDRWYSLYEINVDGSLREPVDDRRPVAAVGGVL